MSVVRTILEPALRRSADLHAIDSQASFEDVVVA